MAPTVKEPATPARKAPGIDDDYLAWVEEQVTLLRARRVDLIDHENFAEELADIGRSEPRDLRSLLEVLLLHMLKWDHQPTRRSRSWSGTIREHRRQVEDLLAESPSLRRVIPAGIARAYVSARDGASLETGIDRKSLFAECPYSWNDIMARPFETDDEIRQP